MKKISAMVLAGLLILTGCSSNTLLVAESFKKTMDTSSFESKTSISLSVHFPENANVPLDDNRKPVMDLLKNGIVVDTIRKNDRESHITISANNPAPILSSELWPYPTAPSFDLYINGNDLLVKSSVDKKFLALASEADNPLDSVTSEQMKQLLKAFVNQYEFNPQHLEKIGQEKITLPDASVSDTTHIRISLDIQEAKDMAVYTVESLSRFEGLKDLPSLLPADAQKDVDVAKIRKDLSDMAQQLKSWNMDELKKNGLDGKLQLNLWIDKDNQIVQDETNIDLRLPNDADQQSGSSIRPIST
ncbi:hypothetical protein LJK88_05290 [Paenibacillus sp. P26]|nr:hypothetical protein LJK88_05290 [Paenibacillus sp. P26]